VIAHCRSTPDALKILERWKCSYQQQGVAIDALDVEEFEKNRLAEASDYEFLKLACHYFRERLSY